MMKKILSIILLVVLISGISQAQRNQSKKPLDFSVYDGWKLISGSGISNDGKWVAYETKPYKGDGELIVMNPNRLKKKTFNRGTASKFSPNSKYIAFKIKPQQDKIRQLKLKKAKKNTFPKDSLCIWTFRNKKALLVENINSFRIPAEKSDWMAYMHTKVKKKGKESKKNKNAPPLFDLVILNPVKGLEYRFKNVSEYTISRNGKLVGFIQISSDSTINSKVSIFNTEEEDIVKIFEKKGLAKKITLDNEGHQSAFIFGPNAKPKVFNLYFWAKGSNATSEIIITTNSLEMPKDWIVSQYGNLWFSRDDSKLYFGTALKPEQATKDTLLAEEKVKVDIWSWTDPLLQSQQLIDLKKEQKRSYLTVYHIKKGVTARLADKLIYETNTILHGNGNIAIGISDSPFRKERSWSFPWYRDIYTVDILTGNKKLALERTSSFVGLSPFGNYIFWFENKDKCWHSINTKTYKESCLTDKIQVNFYDEDFDKPTSPPSYKFAGWTENDNYFLVYDKYDIWKIDPDNIQKPVCITKGYGRKNKISFRYLNLNKDLSYINSKNDLFLSAFNTNNKKSGYYSCNLNRFTNPVKHTLKDFDYNSPLKAKNADKILWWKASATEFPDLWYSNVNLRNKIKISNANPQQKKYIWGNAELVKWNTFDENQEEGLLYKPENFDPRKKYPMIVNIYERFSDKIHDHYDPRPSRSMLDIMYYVSNGYLVFAPNIRYKTGNPGKSAYNYVVSGTKAMISKGFVDENNIGIQGHSWGGYQVAYIITQTDIFKAAMAGAPVSNMTSAYGNIYWRLGISRMSMYESDQSRIGASLWEKPELYVKNSPIFYADRIVTPLLIMHNDADGAVPWDQGIELFVALRRLNKACWLLNYNGEPHNLRRKSPNTKDLSIRMFQYFEHYLKDKPAPVWLEKGIPAIKKGKTLGYELSK